MDVKVIKIKIFINHVKLHRGVSVMETRILVLETELTRWRDCAERRLKRERYLQGELYLRCEQLRAAHEELERQEKKIKIAKEILEEN